MAKSTAETRRYWLKMLSKVLELHTPIRELSVLRLRKLRADLLARGLNPTTVNDIVFKVVRKALEHAVEEG